MSENKTLSIQHQTYIYMASNFFKIVMSIVVTAILSRILNSYDYGIVAIISIFSVFFITISDVGISPAIVQIKELDEDDLNNIYSFSVYLAFISCFLFIVLSLPISVFYDDSILIPTCSLLSASVFFGILNMVPSGIINRNKKFLFLAKRNVVVYLIASVLAIVLALYGFGVYSIVIQSVSAAVLTFLTDYFVTKPKFLFRVNFSCLKKIASFSVFQFFFNLICYASRNLDDLLTGKFISTSQLGYYNKAYTLMLYPVENLVGVFSPVIHPLLSDYQNDRQVIYNKYIILSRLLFLVGAVVSTSCFCCSYEIVTIICGDKWFDAARCFRILSIAIVPQMLNSCVGAIFQSIGNTKLLFINSCINVSVSTLLILIAVFGFKSIFVLSAMIAVVYYCHYLISHYMLMKFGFDRKFRNYLFSQYKEILIFIVLFGIGQFINFNFNNLFISLLVKFTTVIVTFLVVFVAFDEWKLVKEFINKKAEK